MRAEWLASSLSLPCPYHYGCLPPRCERSSRLSRLHAVARSAERARPDISSHCRCERLLTISPHRLLLGSVGGLTAARRVRTMRAAGGQATVARSQLHGRLLGRHRHPELSQRGAGRSELPDHADRLPGLQRPCARAEPVPVLLPALRRADPGAPWAGCARGAGVLALQCSAEHMSWSGAPCSRAARSSVGELQAGQL